MNDQNSYFPKTRDDFTNFFLTFFFIAKLRFELPPNAISEMLYFNSTDHELGSSTYLI